MKLTSKLLGYLHRVYDKDPGAFLALRLRYSGTSMIWAVADGVLTTEVQGGPGEDLDVDLSQYTIAELVGHLAAQPGYTIEFADASALANLSSLVLIDSDGDQDTNNGDHLLGHTSLLWSYLDANSAELTVAKTQIVEMLRQMEIPNAEAEWIDEHGGYYGVRRNLGEADNYYGPRIMVEVARPRGNNIAIEKAINEITSQEVTVTDVVLFDEELSPVYDGAISHDGTSTYNAIGNPIYGLFDVVIGYDLEGGPDVADYSATVASLIETLRDAGTHLRSLSLAAGLMSDVGPPRPADTATISLSAPFTESDAGPDTELVDINIDVGEFAENASSASGDAVNLSILYDQAYNGLRTHNGSINHAGRLVVFENEFLDGWDPSDLFLLGEEGVLYDPSDLSTLWQDAAGTVPVENDGDPVGLMMDLSGNGNHASQAVAAARPVYRTDGTLHWLESDGGDDELVTAAITGQGAQWSAAAAVIFGGAATARATGFSGATPFDDDFGSVDADIPYVLVASRDTDSVEGWLNRVSNGETATTGTPLTPPDGPLTLFTDMDGQFYGGIALLDRALSTAERHNVEDYLAALAGISLIPLTPQSLFSSGEEGVLYDPSDLSTLWQDAAGTVPVENDGDPVGLMMDLSGNGNHASQAVAAARPIYRTDGTLHWLESDGGDDELVTAPIVALGEQWGAAAAARPDLSGVPLASGFSTDTEFQDDFGTVSAGTDYVLTVSRDADSVEGWLNRVSNGETATTGTPLTPGSSPLTLLAGIPGRFYGGLIVSGRVLTSLERQFVDNYLAGLAGIDLSP